MHEVRLEWGTLELIPTYFYHNTIPFESAELRISIAFDAVFGFSQISRGGFAPRSGSGAVPFRDLAHIFRIDQQKFSRPL